MSNVPIMRMFNVAGCPIKKNVAGAKELQGAGVPRAAGGRTQRPGHRLSRVQGPRRHHDDDDQYFGPVPVSLLCLNDTG